MSIGSKADSNTTDGRNSRQPTPTDSVPVLLIDDHPIVAMGLELLLENSADFHVCGAAEKANQAKELIKEHKPSIVVVDLVLEGGDGLRLIRELSKEFPTIKLLVYSSLDETTYAPRAFRAGAHGYLMKSQGLPELLEAINTVVRGDVFASQNMTRVILKQAIRQTTPLDTTGDLHHLSDGELRVFQLIGGALTSSEISKQLGISPKTVSSYKERLKNKLNVETSAELELEAKDRFGIGPSI
jgi:DNA-binding NarL/FixJ family response regulator